MALTKISGNVVQQNNFSLSGVVTATSFTGDLTGNVTGNVTGTATTATNLADGANITTGTISNDRLPATITKNLTGDVTGNLTGNVTGTATTATNLADGANITTGTISNDRLPSTITKNLTGDVTGNLTGNVSSSGANTLGSLAVTNDATVGGALTVTGNLTVNGTTTTIDTVVTAIDSLAVDGDVTAGGNLNITGVSTFVGIVTTQSNSFVGNDLSVAGDARVTGILTVGQNSTTINGAHEYPSIRPTLDLNFAATKTLDRRITFTRDSLGTYVDELGVLKYAPNNTPRFDHDPATGESLGLLIEESRTNLLTNSNTFNSQTVTNVTISANTTDTLSPDETYTASKITDDATNGQHTFLRTYTVASGSNYTSSIFLKKGTQRYVSILSPTATSTKLWATYDLQDGVITGSHTSTTATITSYPNGWYRCTIKTSAGASASAYLQVSFNSTSTNPSWPSTTQPADYSGSGDYFYVWGGQGELGSFPTSYIPTSASTVTRAADIAKITGTNFTDFYNSSEGTTVFEAKTFMNVAGNVYYGEIGDGSVNNRNIMYRNISSGNAIFYYIVGGSVQVDALSSGAPNQVNTNVVSAYAYKENDFGVFASGGYSNTDTSGNIMTNFNSFSIGMNNQNNSEHLNGTIKRVSYYNKRLPNAQLQGLTAQ